jgi:hypothetical protein
VDVVVFVVVDVVVVVDIGVVIGIRLGVDVGVATRVGILLLRWPPLLPLPISDSLRLLLELC